MSENGILHTTPTPTPIQKGNIKPQLKRQKQAESMDEPSTLLENNILMSSPSLDNTNTSSKTSNISQDDERRHSNASSDSQKSGSSSSKKPASLNEIQDLYSALQDLVKTNVSNTTPLPERRNKMMAMAAPPVTNRASTSGRSNSASPGIESPYLGERSLTVPERQLRKLSSRISPSSSFENDILDHAQHSPSSNHGAKTTRKTSKHKRGISTGTMEAAMANLMRISPFPTRKFSHDPETVASSSNNKTFTNNSNTKENKKSSSFGGKKDRTLSNGEHKKQWKGARLFKRLRSRSNAELFEDDKINSTTDDEETMKESDRRRQDKNRRRSEADALRVHRTRDRGLTPQRKSLQEDSSKDIERMVSSLSVDDDKSKRENQDSAALISAKFLQTPTTTYGDIDNSTNSLSELIKLESWFENALTSTTTNGNTNKYVVNSNGASPKDVRNTQRFRKKNGKIVRRASSNAGSSSHHIKGERRARRNINNKFSKSFDANVDVLKHAKSTPDLSKSHRLSQDEEESFDYDDDFVRNDEETSQEISDRQPLAQLENHSESDLEEQDSLTSDLSPEKENVKSSSPCDKTVQRERRIMGRLPDSPVFYVPPSSSSTKTTNDEDEDDSTTVKPLLRKHSEAPMFYTKEEETNNIKNLLSPPSLSPSNPDENQDQKWGNAVESENSPPMQQQQQQQHNRRRNKNLKNSRPKSMFNYPDQEVILNANNTNNDVSKTTSLKLSKKQRNFDGNANDLCDQQQHGKIIDTSSHRLSLCDLSKVGTLSSVGSAQDKTLWDKFRKVAANKKPKGSKWV